MKVEGGCYCRAIRYVVTEAPVMNVQCHCRECQYISGGSPNVIVAVPEAGFSYSSGEPKRFSRKDLANPVTREFCIECGTHLATRAPIVPGVAFVKLGTLDQPASFGNPTVAIFTVDQQPFHQIPAGVATFERMPG